VHLFLDDDQVEPVAAGMLGAMTVGDGPTREQVSVLQAVVSHLWRRPDIDVDLLAPLGADRFAQTVADPVVRRKLVGLLMAIELCRHPLTSAQVVKVDEYAAALAVAGEPLEVIRTWMREGAEQATADLNRFRELHEAEADEPAVVADPCFHDGLDPALTERMLELADLPAGTLGRSYIDFHEQFGLAMPGTLADASFSSALLISHDFTHVIAGYLPTGEGEIALGAMEFAMNDSEGTWSRFLTSLVIHEAGMAQLSDFEAKEATLARPGAAELLGEAFDRGNRCTSDFSRIDHLAMAEWPLEEVRSHFGVVPLAAG
jgi:hypothetical protein